MNINSQDNSYEKNEDISSMMTNLNVRENTSGMTNSNVTSNKNSYFNQDYNK